MQHQQQQLKQQLREQLQQLMHLRQQQQRLEGIQMQRRGMGMQHDPDSLQKQKQQQDQVQMLQNALRKQLLMQHHQRQQGQQQVLANQQLYMGGRGQQIRYAPLGVPGARQPPLPSGPEPSVLQLLALAAKESLEEEDGGLPKRTNPAPNLSPQCVYDFSVSSHELRDVLMEAETEYPFEADENQDSDSNGTREADVESPSPTTAAAARTVGAENQLAWLVLA
jgi:hypothetical protein